MHTHHVDPVVPNWLLGAALALVVCSVLIAGIARLTGIGVSRVPDSATVDRVDFRAQDMSDGSVELRDSASNALLSRVEPGTGGFIRGTLRGLARERQRRGVSPAEPFSLLGRADGRLTLVDTSINRRVDLESFGPTNAAAFASLFTARPRSTAAAPALQPK